MSRNTLSFDPFGYNTLRIESGQKILTAPSTVVSKRTNKSITLRWPVVNKARGYNIFKGDYSGFTPDQYHLIGITSNTFFTDDWLDEGGTYYYVVSAFDEYNQKGAYSKEVEGATTVDGDAPPAKVGVYDSGLISKPRAWRGDTDTILYLQWGQNKEADIAYYELYRSEEKNFELTDKTFVSKVEPGPYATVPYEDTGLKPHITYYYRVRAADEKGNRGKSSELFQGTTREIKGH